MKKLLIITGDLAVGKSTFAKKLSKKYDIAYFYKDVIKEVLADTIGFESKEDSRGFSIVAVKLLSEIFVEFSKHNLPIILESNFHEDEIERLHNLANELSYDVLTLDIYGDSIILFKRFINRRDKENRHPIHLANTMNDYEGFEKYHKKSRSIKLLGNVIKVNANDFSYQEDEKLLKKIEQFLSI